MSPLEIKVLLACYVSPDPSQMFPSDTWHSEAVAAALEKFYQEGAIRVDTNGVTNAGMLVVKRLTSVSPRVSPLPDMHDEIEQ